MTPTPQRQAWLSWSSGKDCAWPLHEIRSPADSELEVDVVGLLTTVNSSADRVPMHGVRRTLLEKQAALAYPQSPPHTSGRNCTRAPRRARSACTSAAPRPAVAALAVVLLAVTGLLALWLRRTPSLDPQRR